MKEIHRRIYELVSKDRGIGQVHLEWCDKEEKIVRMVFEDEWSWLDCFYSLVRLLGVELRHGRSHGIIYDLTASARIPEGLVLVAMEEWIWDPGGWKVDIRKMVVIGGGQQMDEIFEMRRIMAPNTLQYFKRADTLDQAIKLIESWSQ